MVIIDYWVEIARETGFNHISGANTKIIYTENIISIAYRKEEIGAWGNH